jgi:hypothetical protein
LTSEHPIVIHEWERDLEKLRNDLEQSLEMVQKEFSYALNQGNQGGHGQEMLMRQIRKRAIAVHSLILDYEEASRRLFEELDTGSGKLSDEFMKRLGWPGPTEEWKDGRRDRIQLKSLG